jgi:hypothetical protein
VWPGGRLLLRARALTEEPPAAASKRPVLKILRRGVWRRVETMRAHGGGYVASVQLERKGRRASRRFGAARIPRRLPTLQLRAYVRGTGHSNIVLVRVRR